MSNEIIRTPHIMRETSRGLERFCIEDGFFEKRKLFLTTGIDADSANELIKQLMYLNHLDSNKEIVLFINSPGGEVNSGMAIYDCIRMISAPVKTVCTGLAASMGSMIFLAGDKREMFPHTKIMIHDPYYGSGHGGVKPLEMQKRLESLMETRESMCKIIAERTGRTLEEIYEKTCTDSFFNAQEAIKFGIATAITEKL